MPEVLLGTKPFSIRTLTTHADQEMGFQHYQQIPDHFGFLFPKCGGQFFHMMNVGAPLLILAVDPDGTITEGQIREPSTPPRRIGSYGQHVLEVHPKHAQHFRPGSSLLSGKL